jgi:hypothetical protein
MRWLWFLILPWFLAACVSASSGQVVSHTATSQATFTLVPGFAATKYFQLTGEAETMTAGVPRNDATITAIMASKYAGRTAMAETFTALPTDTPIPTLPAGSGLCRAAELKSDSHSNGAGGNIFLGVWFTNVGTAPCYLQTRPQVQLVDRLGNPLDVRYTYWDKNSPTPGSGATGQPQSGSADRIGLQPGKAAGFSLVWSNWCGPAATGNVVIHLSLGQGAGSIDVPTDVQGGGRCDTPGSGSSVEITAFEYVSPQP